jgi:hypothetical protein
MNEISAVNGIFPVQSLAAFKGKEVEDGFYMVRKIEKGTGLESKGVVIPKIEQEVIVASLENGAVFEAVCQWYQEQVGEVVKARISAGATSIIPSDYSLEQLVEYLQAEEVKQGRVSKEKIAAWFDANVSYTLTKAFTEKLGQVENEKMVAILNAYKVQFASLAKREVSLSDPVAANLSKALELLPESNMKEYCKAKIEAGKKQEIDLMMAL